MTVHQAYVEQLDTDQRYDVIVSGLPLTNFTPRRSSASWPTTWNSSAPAAR